MTWAILAVFAAVYLGMMFGRFPGLALDRTGIALLGAIAMVALGALGPEQAWLAIDVPTMGLLFGLMVVSAQFRLGGFYTAVTRRVATLDIAPARLLLVVVLLAAGLSALLCNDIICLAMAPLLLEGCARRKLDPKPFLLGLACASNVGSAATLIGNPQNMLIGQRLQLSFGGYLAEALPPVLAGLIVTWLILVWRTQGRWHAETPMPPLAAPAFSAWQAGKGVAVLLVVVVLFLAAPVPREIVAMGAAGILLLSRRMQSRDMLGLVDWPLLVLFAGLFVVHAALQTTGLVEQAVAALRNDGIDLARPAPLFGVTVILSNLVSNVPATMLLLPAATHPAAGIILALASTLAGNLLLVGSIANLIVVDQAERSGIHIGWAEHARVGVPVTLATLVIAGVWIAWQFGG